MQDSAYDPSRTVRIGAFAGLATCVVHSDLRMHPKERQS
jgi:hypothetical protein